MAKAKTLEIKMSLRDEVTRNLSGIRRAFNTFSGGVSKSIRFVSRAVFSLQGALVGLGVTLTGGSFIKAAADMEKFQTRLTAVIGNAAEAQKTFNSLVEFAARSPVNTDELIDSYVTLEAIGIPALDKTIKKIAEVALVQDRAIRDVSAAFVSLEKEPLRNLGIEIDRTGEKAVITAGKGARRIQLEVDKSTGAIREALIELWTRQFPNAMELAEKDFDGKMDAFKGAFRLLSADIGKLFLPSIKSALDSVTGFINDNRTKIVAFIASIPVGFNLIIEKVKKILSELTFADIVDAFNFAVKWMFLVFVEFFDRVGSYIVAIGAELWKPLIITLAAALNAGVKGFLKGLQKVYELPLLDVTGSIRETLQVIINDFETTGEILSGIQLSSLIGSEDQTALEKFLKKASEQARKLRKDLESSLPETDIKQRYLQELAEIEQKMLQAAATATEELSATGDAAQEIVQDFSRLKLAITEIESAVNASPLQDFWQGFKQSISESAKSFTDWAKHGRNAAIQLAEGLSSSMANSFSSVIRGTKSVSEAFEEMGNRILDTIANIVSNILAQQAIGFLVGDISRFAPSPVAGSTGLLGSLFSGFGGGGLVPIADAGFAFKDGGVMPGGFKPLPIPAFAGGGVVNRPTFGLIGEGSGPEAVVPLKNGAIPIEGNTGNVTINVNMVVQAWDARDVQRNAKQLANSVAREIHNNTPVRGAFQKYL